MKFFADTANLKEIELLFNIGVNDGITTNPMIMQSTGNMSKGFEHACREITKKYVDVPVSLETDLRGIEIGKLEELSGEVKKTLLEQALQLAKFGENVVVKIPICSGGLETTRELSQRGIKTNVTACMNPYQALEATRAGATYVSMFANRMLDSTILDLAGYDLEQISIDSGWKKTLESNKNKFYERAWSVVLNDIAYVAQKLYGTNSNLIVGSIRLPEDIRRLALIKPHVITIPAKIAMQLNEEIPILKRTEKIIEPTRKEEGVPEIHHPMTLYTLAEFERAADSYRDK